MEVHAHSHTPRKKWSHYVWEFLMLFLAVFCGFLAENQREHYVEHQRERQYMRTMLEDLESDTGRLSEAIKYWNEKNYSVDSVTDAIGTTLNTTNLKKAYRHLNNALDFFSFAYNDRTITQLKNAGNFRLIRKRDVAKKILDYDRFNTDAVKHIAYQYEKFYELITQLRNKVFLQEILYPIFQKYKFEIPPLSMNGWIDSMITKFKAPYTQEVQEANLFEFKNALIAYRKDFSNLKWANENLMKYSRELIVMIEEEYHLGTNQK